MRMRKRVKMAHVKSTMIYPHMPGFASLVLVFMLLFIVPVFVKVFDQLGGQSDAREGHRDGDVKMGYATGP